MSAKKLTTQEFINRARAVHGDKYGYAFSVYKSTHEKLLIYCPEHGMFGMTPANHNSGHGCPTCSGKKKHSNLSFIEKARKVHGENIYDYSLIDYVNNSTKVFIVCKTHGVFSQLPSNHMVGRGCPDCADKSKKSTDEKFIEKARKVHGDSFDYSQVNYVNARRKVKIICPTHGVFYQMPHHHLSGHSCPGCANYGFDRTKKGFLYILRSECGTYMKIGITNKPSRRQTELKRHTPFSFKRIELIEGQGDQIANLEKELLAQYQSVEFTERFSGHSEWFLFNESIRHKLLTSKIQG